MSEPRSERYPYDSPLVHPRAAQAVTALAPVPSRNEGAVPARGRRVRNRRGGWRRKAAAVLR